MFSLSFVFFSFILLGVHGAFWICKFRFYNKFGEFSAIISSNISLSYSFLSFLLKLQLHMCQTFSCCPTGLMFCSFSCSVFFSLLQVGSFLSVCLQIHWLFNFLHSVSSSNDFFWNIYILYSLVLELPAFSLLLFLFLCHSFLYIFIYSFRPLSIIMKCLKILICSL